MKIKWKRLLGFAKDDVLGLDIGSSSVRMVQLARENDGFSVVSAAITDIDPVESESDSKEDNTIKAVQKCLMFSKTRSKWAICSVSGIEVAVRHFKFPPLEPDVLDGAIRLEASQVCPFNIDDAVVDYQLIHNGSTDGPTNGSNEGTKEESVAGILVAATNDVIRRKLDIVQKASLNCVLMDVDGLALLNCLMESKKDISHISSAAILDVGGSTTTLAVMSENNFPFVRTVPYAGKDIVSQIARDNNVTPQIVRKDIYSTSGTTVPAENLRKSMEKACQKLVSDVAETLRYHNAQEKSSPVEQILVCGGFGMVKGFVDILNRQLPVKAVLWNPFDTMKCTVSKQILDVIQSKGPVMAVAAGLAMRTI
jgi:type IV pilus assembly protein PilM